MTDLDWWMVYSLIAACALVAFIWLVVPSLDGVTDRLMGRTMLAPAGADTIDPVEEEDLAAFKSSKPLSPGGELKVSYKTPKGFGNTRTAAKPRAKKAG